MGLKVTDVAQSVIQTTTRTINLVSRPHIAFVSEGSRPRHRIFRKVLPPETVVIICSGDAAVLQHEVDRALSGTAAEGDLKVLIDVSCLPRTSIAIVLTSLGQLADRRIISLQIGYSLAKYAPSPTAWGEPNIMIRPVHPLLSGWTSQGANAPLDIVVGLGYERGKAIGAVEYLEPRFRWVFVPQSPEKDYLEEVLQHNKGLIDSNPSRVSEYEVFAPADTYFMLRSLTEGLAKESRPVLLPFGPKIFLQ